MEGFDFQDKDILFNSLGIVAPLNVSELGGDIITATHQNIDLAAVQVMELSYERDFLAIGMGLVEKPR